MNIHVRGIWIEIYNFLFFSPQAAYKEWSNFHIYHSLFFKNQSFGPGGNNLDTAGTDDDDRAGISAASTPTPNPSPSPAVPGVPHSVGKTLHSDSDSDLETVEAGRKPSRKTTRRRSSQASQFQFGELYAKMRKEEIAAEERRELERRDFEMKLFKERQEAEDRRERERREYDEGRAREQREYEEKREAERTREQAEIRQSEKEFNAALLVQIFHKK